MIDVGGQVDLSGTPRKKLRRTQSQVRFRARSSTTKVLAERASHGDTPIDTRRRARARRVETETRCTRGADRETGSVKRGPSQRNDHCGRKVTNLDYGEKKKKNKKKKKKEKKKKKKKSRKNKKKKKKKKKKQKKKQKKKKKKKQRKDTKKKKKKKKK